MDVFDLQIRLDSATETTILPFSLEVDVSFVQLEIVTKNMPVEVKQLGGQSSVLDSTTLQFTYNRSVPLNLHALFKSRQSKGKRNKRIDYFCKTNARRARCMFFLKDAFLENYVIIIVHFYSAVREQNIYSETFCVVWGHLSSIF